MERLDHVLQNLEGATPEVTANLKESMEKIREITAHLEKGSRDVPAVIRTTKRGIQEIRDGDPAASNDEFGGATSQAWSLSELLRTVAEDYAGIDVDLSVDPPRVTVDPQVPAQWPELSVTQRVGEHLMQVRAHPDGRGLVVEGIPRGWIVAR